MNEIEKPPVYMMDVSMKDMDAMMYSHLSKAERLAHIEPVRTESKIRNNEPCPCGSGKKYKKCCKYNK